MSRCTRHSFFTGAKRPDDTSSPGWFIKSNNSGLLVCKVFQDTMRSFPNLKSLQPESQKTEKGWGREWEIQALVGHSAGGVLREDSSGEAGAQDREAANNLCAQDWLSPTREHHGRRVSAHLRKPVATHCATVPQLRRLQFAACACDRGPKG
jgi:hypothetical protein